MDPLRRQERTEAVEIGAQRKLLNDVLNRLQGAKTQLELVAVEAEQQAGRASSIQRNQFFQKIFESSKSILNPYLWSDAGAGLTVFLQRLGALIGNWWNQIQHTASVSSLLLLPLDHSPHTCRVVVCRPAYCGNATRREVLKAIFRIIWTGFGGWCAQHLAPWFS